MTSKGNSSTWKRPDLPFVVPVSRIFNLREACRQTRAEIDPLQPYRSNIFTFRHPSSVAWFSDTLTPHQRNAIEHIALPHVDIFLRSLTFPASIRDELPGVTQVLITGSVPVTIRDEFIGMPTKACCLFRLGCSPDVPLEVRIVDLIESTVAVEGSPGFVIHPKQKIDTAFVRNDAYVNQAL